MKVLTDNAESFKRHFHHTERGHVAFLEIFSMYKCKESLHLREGQGAKSSLFYQYAKRK